MMGYAWSSERPRLASAMTGAQSADMIWYVLASTLVVGALLSRRIPARKVVVMALAWVAIFGFILVLFSYRDELFLAGTRVRHDVLGKAPQTTQGDALHVRMGDDGHFWVDGQINGTSARFLIDSGATITALSDEVATSAGLDVDRVGPGLAMSTANGTVVARRSQIAGLTIGPITTYDLPIIVSDRFNGVNVLGMNFLSRLKGWRVENGEMILQP